MLRVLQSKEVVHLGGSQTLPVHARMIAATNRNLEEAVKDGSFREDFYYRINVFPVFLPALRDKKQDIPDLVAHFLVLQGKNANHIDPKAMDLLIQYHWPGNVRELENIIQRSLIMAGDQQITVSDLPPYLRGESEAPLKNNIQDEELTLDEMEWRMIQRALTKTKGNKSKAAELLGITRRQLYSKTERLMKLFSVSR